jgi:hypothetical protein
MSGLDLTEGVEQLVRVNYSQAEAEEATAIVAPLIERQVRDRIAAEQLAQADRYTGPGNDHDDRVYGQGIRFAASIARGEQSDASPER